MAEALAAVVFPPGQQYGVDGISPHRALIARIGFGLTVFDDNIAFANTYPLNEFTGVEILLPSNALKADGF
ncbi:MAG: hypothetical protein WB992_17460 [Bryobacteraceae bacterium]